MLYNIIITIIAIAYVITGVMYANIAWGTHRHTNGLPKRDEAAWLMSHARAINSWSHAAPEPSLREYYGKCQTTTGYDSKRAAAKVRAYRRTFFAPIWPVLLVNDVLSGYNEAKVLSQPHLLEKQREQLEKAQKYAETLNQAFEDASKVINIERYNPLDNPPTMR